MKRFQRLLAVMIVGIAAAVGIGFAAAPAQAEAGSGAPAASVEPLSARDCLAVLADNGYPANVVRIAACVIGGSGAPSAFPGCVAALRATGVPTWLSGLACLRAGF